MTMLYTLPQRLIYESPGGTRYDPLALHRRLITAAGGSDRLNENLAVWGEKTAPEVNRAAAEEYIVTAARAAFALKPFDQDGGCTDAEVLVIAEDFLEWLRGKDLRGPVTLVSPLSTDLAG